MKFLKNKKYYIYSRILIFLIFTIFLINCIFVSVAQNISYAINTENLINTIHINENQYENLMVNEVEPYLNKLIDQ